MQNILQGYHCYQTGFITYTVDTTYWDHG